ncbi:MAG: ECF transporter S component [Eubacteriales bacterium]|nr:ECF transporter S component [Eubacteriales bacterium]
MKSKNLKRLAAMAVLAAVSVALASVVHFPVFPAVAFLEYDPADIPVLICGFAFGPSAGIFVVIVASLIQGLTVSASSGLYGILMHVIASSALVLTSSLIYRKHKTRKGAVAGICFGVLAMAAVMIPANLLITPYFMGCERSLVVDLLPYIILFNLIKAGINGIITFLIYKKISVLLHKLDDEKN